MNLRFLLIGLLALCGCSAPQILNVQQPVSRDLTTLCFAHNHKAYRHQGVVGGEHISTLRIVAFEGDRFSIRIDSDTPDLYRHLSGEGIRIRPVQSLTRESVEYDVTVQASITTISLALSSHPDTASYTVVIRPFPPTD